MAEYSLKPRQVAWIGSRDQELGWLYQHVESHTGTPLDWLGTHTIDDLDWTAGSISDCDLEGQWKPLAERCQAGVDRLIVSCDTRLSYPAELIDRVLAEFPEIPLGVATGTWWGGARRTGIGQPEHLLLPWYRWWDGWLPWLRGRNPQLFGPIVTPTAAATPFVDELDATAPPQPSNSACVPASDLQPTGTGWVIAECAATGRGWCLVAERESLAAFYFSPRRLLSLAEGDLPAPDWLLMDDSCLAPDVANDDSRWPGLSGGLGGLERMIEACHTHCPAGRWSAALTQPDWSLWSYLLRRGFSGLVAKPDSGNAFWGWIKGEVGSQLPRPRSGECS